MKLLRTRHINALFIATAAVLLLYFLWSYSETGSPPIFSTQQELIEQPEFYIRNTHITQFNAQGTLDMMVDSEEVVQNPVNDSVNLHKPRLNLFNEGKPSWDIEAQTGFIYDKGETVNLEQQVVALHRQRETRLQTPQMVVYPNKRIAETDQVVTLSTHQGSTEAIGLKANLNTHRIDLLNNVRGRYEPQAISNYVE